jgi:hypothetical protein
LACWRQFAAGSAPGGGDHTPNGLHYERHHAGVPEINPDAHRLLIHRLVDRTLICTIEIVQIVGLA